MNEENKLKKYTSKKKLWGIEKGNQLGEFFFLIYMYIRRKQITSPSSLQTLLLWHWGPCPASTSARSTLQSPSQWDMAAGILAPNLSPCIILNTLNPFSSSQDPIIHALWICWAGLGARSLWGGFHSRKSLRKSLNSSSECTQHKTRNTHT